MDAEKTYFKLTIFTTITATLTSTAAAQLSGNSEIPGTEFTISGIINAMLFWDLGSGAGFWVGLMMFLATWGGFYFASRPLFLELYGFILDNFPTSDNRRSWSTTEDDEPIGMKGLALTTSFVTTQVVGQFFGLVPMILLGGIGFLVFLWSMYYGQKAFRENFSNTLRDNSGDNGDDIEDADERAGDGQENLDQAGDDIDQSEEDVGNGNPGDADREAEAAAQHIEKAVQDIEIAEEDLMAVFGSVQNQVGQTLEELEHTTEIAENEEEIIQRISKLPKEVNQFVEGIEESLDPDVPTQQDLVGAEKIEAIERLYNESEGIGQSLNTLIEEIQEESKEESEEERELLTELKELIEIHKLIKEIGQEIKLGRKEDEELEKIAKQLEDTELYNEVETEENQERKLLDQLQELQNQEDVIEDNIRKADKLITHIASLDNEELKQLQGEDNEYQNAAEGIRMYLKTLERNNMDHYEQDDVMIGDLAETLYNKLGEIDEKIEKAGRMEQEDLRKAKEMKDELENLVQQLEQ